MLPIHFVIIFFQAARHSCRLPIFQKTKQGVSRQISLSRRTAATRSHRRFIRQNFGTRRFWLEVRFYHELRYRQLNRQRCGTNSSLGRGKVPKRALISNSVKVKVPLENLRVPHVNLRVPPIKISTENEEIEG